MKWVKHRSNSRNETRRKTVWQIIKLDVCFIHLSSVLICYIECFEMYTVLLNAVGLLTNVFVCKVSQQSE